MAFGEIYTGLQQGTIDGVDTSIIYVQDGNFQEVTNYCTETNHMVMQVMTFINAEYFDSLPADLQEIVLTAAEKATVEQRKIAIEVDDKARKVLEDAGVVINIPSPELVEQMVAATRPVFEQYKAEIDEEILKLAGF
jgi:TRAP-type C4-dicarboxylate transport system substrate-binding protein